MTTPTHRAAASASLPTQFGDFEIDIFPDTDNVNHVALHKGRMTNNLLVRIHSECMTGDVFRSLRCDCGKQLETAMKMITDAAQGLIIYMGGHEGRGIGLANKIKAYALQDSGFDTVDANLELGFAPDQRDYTAAISILRQYNLNEVRLLTNNSNKIAALNAGGIKVTEQIPLWTATNPHDEKYLQTKRERMGHIAG